MRNPSPLPAIDANYFREYRRHLGFPNQSRAKDFFKAADVKPELDWDYVERLAGRLATIVNLLQEVVPAEIAQEDVKAFICAYIDLALEQIRKNRLLPRLNNQGRRPEEVFFSWMRGYVMSHFFKKALALIFSVDPLSIQSVGRDNLDSAETFRRAPTADFQLKRINGSIQRIEMQSGFSGINDIKQHKVLEAKRLFLDASIQTMAIHFDLFNGQVAFVPLNKIEDNSTNWITRQQMEGQTVFNINQNYFLWRVLDLPRTAEEYELALEA